MSLATCLSDAPFLFSSLASRSWHCQETAPDAILLSQKYADAQNDVSAVSENIWKSHTFAYRGAKSSVNKVYHRFCRMKRGILRKLTVLLSVKKAPVRADTDRLRGGRLLYGVQQGGSGVLLSPEALPANLHVDESRSGQGMRGQRHLELSCLTFWALLLGHAFILTRKSPVHIRFCRRMPIRLPALFPIQGCSWAVFRAYPPPQRLRKAWRERSR